MIRLIAIIVALFLTVAVHASVEDLDPRQLNQHQKQFLNAYEAIQANERKELAVYKKQLKHYVLYPYVEYLDMVKNIHRTPKSNILGFITRNTDSLLAERLKFHWLRALGKHKDWHTFLTHYDASIYANSHSIQCYYQTAKLKTSSNNAPLRKEAVDTWLSSENNGACRQLSDQLHQKKWLSGSDIWQKITTLMNKGKLSSASRVAKKLSSKERQWLTSWKKIYRKPSLILSPIPKKITPVVKKPIFIQGIRRLAKRNLAQATKRFQVAADQYGLSPNEKQTLQNWLQTRATKLNASVDVESWLKLSETDPSLLPQGLRKAIKQSDWTAYIELYYTLSNEQQQKPQWRYWYANALSKTEDSYASKKVIKRIYRSLSESRGYYSFLAADKLKKPYQFTPEPKSNKHFLLRKPAQLAQLVDRYFELRMIKELIAIDWHTSAQRQWHYLLQKVEPHDFEAISYLASEWNQHHIAIQSLAKIKKWDVLDIRFPTPYDKPVMEAAEQSQIDPTWIYGIIRKESAFSETATSHVGAIGLMQLMPQTASYMGKKLGLPTRISSELKSPQVNIKLGAAYLSYLMDRFNQNQILSTAAYNAGPNAVKRWLPKHNETVPADQWIESIPYKETRNYVKTVLEYMTIFQSLTQNRYVRLKYIMQPITAINKPINEKK